MVRKINLAPFGWTSRLATAVLMTGIALQGCDSSVDKVETQEVKADDLVAIVIMMADDGHGLVCGKKGFINTKGVMVIPPRFAYCRRISGTSYKFGGQNFTSNGLAAVTENGKKWGYINTKGEMVIPARFKRAGSFSRHGLAYVEDSKGWGFINIKGKKVFGTIDSFVDDSPGFVDDRPVTNPDDGPSTDNPTGLRMTCENGHCGYVNAQGEMVIPARFDFGSSFAANGLAAIRDKNRKWGYINAKGKMLITPKFDIAEDFSSSGVARVEESGKVSYINETGQVIVYIDEIEGRKAVKNARNEVIWSEE